jgi:type-F conjugative transfer system pilin assembly protein TrbC
LILFLISFSNVFAVDYQKEGENFAKEKVKEQVNQKLDLEKILEDKSKLKTPKGKGAKGESCKNCVANLENPMANFEAEFKEKDRMVLSHTILVFISFSMPNVAIKELNSQVAKYGAKLILRGLHEKSFKKTAEKILEIDNRGVQVDINPELFRKYNIKKVPTFVLIRNGEEVSRISGNVSLEYAKFKLRESFALQDDPGSKAEK